MDYFAELARKPLDAEETNSATAHYHLSIANNRKREDADPLRAAWGKTRLKVDLLEPDATLWQLIAVPTFDLSILPPYSFNLRFTFTLAQPYLSKDENAFYIIDNPIVRDKVFRLPLVRASSWKGNLCATLWQLGHKKEQDEMLQRLFGTIRGDEVGQSGRLIFFPAFFTQTSLEIINPHDRERRVGKNPILFESVPIGARGTFTLLYVPFDRVGEDEQTTREQVAEELPLVAKGLQAMFRVYGFSAKRTSGFGLAQAEVADGRLTLRAAEAAHAATLVPSPTVSPPTLPKYLEAPGRLKSQYRNPDGTFRERSEAERQKMSKSERQEYDKAKGWWEREGKAGVERGTTPPAPPAPIQPPQPEWLTRTFGSFKELGDRTSEIAALLKGGAR